MFLRQACGENLRRYGTRMDSAWFLRAAYYEANKIKMAQDTFCQKAEAGLWESLDDDFPENLQWEMLVDVLRGKVKVNNVFPMLVLGLMRSTGFGSLLRVGRHRPDCTSKRTVHKPGRPNAHKCDHFSCPMNFIFRSHLYIHRKHGLFLTFSNECKQTYSLYIFLAHLWI